MIFGTKRSQLSLQMRCMVVMIHAASLISRMLMNVSTPKQMCWLETMSRYTFELILQPAQTILLIVIQLFWFFKHRWRIDPLILDEVIFCKFVLLFWNKWSISGESEDDLKLESRFVSNHYYKMKPYCNLGLTTDWTLCASYYFICNLFYS